MGTSDAGPRPRRRSGLGYLIVLLVAIAAVFAGVYLVYLSEPGAPPTNELVFSVVVVDASGNASWAVDSVTGGPYSDSGFSVRLIVNGFSTDWSPLGPNDTIHRVVVGTFTYRIAWSDADGDGALTKGDAFVVTGDNARLPSLSTFEFKLKWLESWISTARWSTD